MKTPVNIEYTLGRCSLGTILVAASDKGVCAILLGDRPDPLVRNLQERFAGAQLLRADARLARLVAKIVGFVESPGKGLEVPLDARGTPFQRRVWQALQAIPAGSTASYTDIANRIGAPNSVRAVAGACAANAIAVAIPCHRVVRNDGAISGYRWGVARKRALLAREGAR
jgi:AraC family transcriptional regulator, regulatory protein of adaptative response / methylated-DNA-[protein]-cysteine methyltransferase